MTGNRPQRLHGAALYLLLGGFLLTYFSWQAFHWIPLDTNLVGNLFWMPLNVAAVWAAWAASRRARGSRRLQRAWRLIALGVAAYLAGSVAEAIYEVVLDVPAYPTVADLLYVSFFPLMLAGILSFPTGPRSGLRRIAIALDCAIVAIGGGTLFLYLILGPTAVADARPIDTAVSCAYPIGDMVLLFGLASALLKGSLPATRGPLLLMAPGLALFVLADLIFGYLVLHGGYATGDPLDLLYVGAMALLLMAAAAQRPVDRELKPGSTSQQRGSRWLPYVAVFVGLAVLIASESNESSSIRAILTLAAAVLASLIMARQFVAQRQLIVVQRELQAAHDELAAIANTDTRTGLPNHRGMKTTIERELARTQRSGRPLALLFLDIDRFKALNDAAGHAAGDAALAEFSFLVAGCLRASDVLGRWGGEEFIALLPESDVDGALLTAERIRGRVDDHVFRSAGGVRLTCSIGVATYPENATEPLGLIDAADRAMYKAKRLGRNQVILAVDAALAMMSTPPTPAGAAMS